MIRVSPSIASANPLHLAEAVQFVEREGYEDLHIDIEDGNFIPNITFGMKTIRALRAATGLPFSFHLMANRPDSYLNAILRMNPSIVFCNVEALQYPAEFLAPIRNAGVRAGLALNPMTSVENVAYLLERCDGLLVMTAEPDGEDQKFLPSMLRKARIAKEIAPSLELWIDGAVSKESLKEFEAVGIDVAVMGRSVFSTIN